jgi:hypothetical protein
MALRGFGRGGESDGPDSRGARARLVNAPSFGLGVETFVAARAGCPGTTAWGDRLEHRASRSLGGSRRAAPWRWFPPSPKKTRSLPKQRKSLQPSGTHHPTCAGARSAHRGAFQLVQDQLLRRRFLERPFVVRHSDFFPPHRWGFRVGSLAVPSCTYSRAN